MSNWYIDFDSTLYDTPKLTKDMLEELALYIDKSKKEEILEELHALFNRENIYNIFTLCEFLEQKYALPNNTLRDIIYSILDNGSKYVYDDSVSFLENLTEKKCTINLLTSVVGTDNMEFQNLKIKGSGLAKYFQTIIITANPKHTLDLKYENGFFVDDNPEDLKNLYSANSKRVIRLKRENGRYSNIQMNIPEIKEYNSLKDLQLKI